VDEQQLREAEYEQYDHGWGPVWVRKGAHGKHRERCLCYDCALFKPNQSGNCERAQASYEFCVKWDCVTQMWECPDFVPGRPDFGAVQ
jgi:hypothetical protein